MASSSQAFPLTDSNFSSSSSSSSESDPFGSLIQQDQDKFYEIMNSVKPKIVEQVFQVCKKKQYIHRDLEGSNYQLMKDYFNESCTYPPEYFHRRFRMRRELFLCILNDVKAYDDYFVQKNDATGRLGLSSIQKMTTAVRILVYGCAADHYDEYFKIGESTAIKCLKAFCNTIVVVYAEEYMRPPNEADIAWLFEEGEQRGFPGMLGSIDYYPAPNHFKRKIICSATRGSKKRCEQDFGVLQIKWAITQGPVRYWEKDDLRLVMKTCIILHNMIIEDERHANVRRWTPPLEDTILIPTLNRCPSVLAAHISSRQLQIRNRETNTRLRNDLMENLWNHYADEDV
ncbi:uncharacterized protein LOC132276364 [Cornus florida]|uniref:uncharacterized protein LOC132276364 n=1 Tax=Cornus florida TaxID=4283 RepID=UPI002898429F|nr:uncharacterized protein LOC132276364 [Cornus florida]